VNSVVAALDGGVCSSTHRAHQVFSSKMFLRCVIGCLGCLSIECLFSGSFHVILLNHKAGGERKIPSDFITELEVCGFTG
jgi:hypothetical protein